MRRNDETIEWSRKLEGDDYFGLRILFFKLSYSPKIYLCKRTEQIESSSQTRLTDQIIS